MQIFRTNPYTTSYMKRVRIMCAHWPLAKFYYGRRTEARVLDLPRQWHFHWLLASMCAGAFHIIKQFQRDCVHCEQARSTMALDYTKAISQDLLICVLRTPSVRRESARITIYWRTRKFAYTKHLNIEWNLFLTHIMFVIICALHSLREAFSEIDFSITSLITGMFTLTTISYAQYWKFNMIAERHLHSSAQANQHLWWTAEKTSSHIPYTRTRNMTHE